MNPAWVTGVVLAAGSSRRLGSPKQLLPYRDSTLLDATLGVARGCGFDQLIVTLGGAADAVQEKVALDGLDVVVSADFAGGCSSSLRAALARVDARAAGMVLLLGDQPGVTSDTVARLLAGAGTGPVAVCRYTDSIGHPFWLGRSLFGELAQLHGDKAVWKLIDRAAAKGRLVEIDVPGPVPMDVDTWADYRRLLAVTP